MYPCVMPYILILNYKITLMNFNYCYVGLDENYIYHVLFITDVDHPLSYIYPTLTYYGLDQYLIYDNK